MTDRSGTALTFAAERQTILPNTAGRADSRWFVLGWPAFGAMIAIFWLMIAKPPLW